MFLFFENIYLHKLYSIHTILCIYTYICSSNDIISFELIIVIKEHRLSNKNPNTRYKKLPLQAWIREVQETSTQYKPLLLTLSAFQRLKVSPYCWRYLSLQTQDPEDLNCLWFENLLPEVLKYQKVLCKFPGKSHKMVAFILLLTIVFLFI